MEKVWQKKQKVRNSTLNKIRSQQLGGNTEDMGSSTHALGKRTGTYAKGYCNGSWPDARLHAQSASLRRGRQHDGADGRKEQNSNTVRQPKQWEQFVDGNTTVCTYWTREARPLHGRDELVKLRFNKSEIRTSSAASTSPRSDFRASTQGT